MQDLSPRIGRETKVGDLTVRASSVDVRTVGAGGGSIAHVPELTKALRVGPQSAGADPGPAAYGKGGTRARPSPTPTSSSATCRRRWPAARSPWTSTPPAPPSATVAEAMGLESAEAAAAGIVDIVNENMLGGLRLVSVQQGFDPRDFALVAFGGAGPLHANALGQADRRVAGDRAAVTRRALRARRRDHQSARDESARTVLRRFADARRRRARPDPRASSPTRPGGGWPSRACRAEQQTVGYQVDVRYHGQGFEIPVDVDGRLDADSARRSASAFDAEHERLFSFLLDRRPRAGQRPRHGHRPASRTSRRSRWRRATATRPAPVPSTHPIYVERRHGSTPPIYDRAKLRAGDVVTGPAIVTEMDSTTLVLPGHAATVHPSGLPADPPVGMAWPATGGRRS